MTDIAHIRNFCIIAHIDHGKSTLADRMLELTETVSKRDLREQLLDNMDLERERGITIKAHPVTMKYVADDGHEYIFNLIDTPGHVDFTYEVSRSLAACEGAILIVDAAQGVEAQTVANTHLAMEHDLAIIPVLNKIDLPNANVEDITRQLEDILAIPGEECLHISAKTGEGIRAVLQSVVARIPPPTKPTSDKTRALVFDSMYDAFRGVISYIRVFEGQITKKDQIKLLSTGNTYEVKETGIFTPKPEARPSLNVGGVGYIVANIKDASEIKIGDTITLAKNPSDEPLPGYKDVHPMVFSGIYPVDTSDYEKLTYSMEKLQLNDSSFQYQPESSAALGLGFRCGFLGLLHLEIIQERLRREYDMDIITTYPGVVYEVIMKDASVKLIDNPVYLPDLTQIDEIREPTVLAHIICHNENIGDMMQLIMDKRGEISKTESIDTRRVMLSCQMPLNEILIDFHDRLKSVTKGFASMDYEFGEYVASDLVKLDVMVHGEVVDAFSTIVHRDKAESRGRQMCKSLKEVIPSQMFAVAVQAAIQKKIIARETIRAMRKDVTSKCYGGDITRKRKLLEKQKEGKKKMKQIGQVSIPQEAFIQVLKTSN